MKVKVIVDLCAGGQGSLEKTGDISRSLVSAGIDYDLVVSRKPDQIKKEAITAACSSYDAVISAGGDGTIHEVINGLITASGSQPTCHLGILPFGGSNKFGSALKIPQDLFAAAKIIAAGNTLYLDAAWVSFLPGNSLNRAKGKPAGCYFNSQCDAAFESMLIQENVGKNGLRAKLETLFAAYRYLLEMQPWQTRIIWDQGAFEGKTTLFSVAIGKRNRGPYSELSKRYPEDGLFDLIFTPEMSRTELFLLMPYILLGISQYRPNLFRHRSSKVYLESEPPTPLVVDGESITASAWKTNLEVIPNKIKLLTPEII